MLQKIRTAIYHTPNIAAAKEWYSKLLGMEPYFDQPFYVGFNVNGFELGLDPDTTNVTTGNNTYALWNVDNLELVVEKILEIGGSLHSAIQTVGEGMRVATCKDPWENCIGLIEEKIITSATTA